MVNVGAWMWTNEHEHVSSTKSFLKYSADIEGISKEYFLTHGI
jgi:hypothetical protein